MPIASDEHRQKAQEIIAQFIDNGQSIPPGALPVALRDAIATALANERESTRNSLVLTAARIDTPLCQWNCKVKIVEALKES